MSYDSYPQAPNTPYRPIDTTSMPYHEPHTNPYYTGLGPPTTVWQRPSDYVAMPPTTVIFYFHFILILNFSYY